MSNLTLFDAHEDDKFISIKNTQKNYEFEKLAEITAISDFDFWFPGLKLLGNQVKLPVGRIDILAESNDALFVIEVKFKNGNYWLVNGIGQLHLYSAYIANNWAYLPSFDSFDINKHIKLILFTVNYGISSKMQSYLDIDGIITMRYQYNFTEPPTISSPYDLLKGGIY